MAQSESVRKFIRSYISGNNLAPGSKLPSLRNIAGMTGSSLLTVHRAVSSMVSEGVLTARKSSGIYVAQTTSARSNVIGMFFPFKVDTNVYLSSLRCALHECIALYGKLPVSLYCDSKQLLDLRGLGLGGAVIYNDGKLNSRVHDGVSELGIPSVCINDMPSDENMNTVGTDNFASGRMVARYFIERGHRKFMILPSTGKGSSVIERISGFKMEMFMQGIPEQNCCVYSGSGNRSVPETDLLFIRGAAEFLKKERGITAVFAINDWMAFLLAQQLSAVSLKVPDDISIIGFDNQHYSETMEPALTSVKHPVQEIAHEAVKMLFEEQNSGSTSRGRTVSFRPDIIERNSVKNITSPGKER